MSTRIALILSLAFGLVAVFAARAWIVQEERRLDERERRVMIVVAGRNLRSGQVIRLGDLAPDELPRAFAIRGMRPWSEARSYEGRVLTQDLDAGSPVLESVLEPGRDRPGSVDRLVPPGKRAVTLPVSAEDSHSYMVRPGDYVDIVAYMEIDPAQRPVSVVGPKGESSPLPPLSAGDPMLRVPMETVLLAEAVPVLAVDNQGLEMSVSNGGGKRAATYRTFTLAMDPDNAYRLIDIQNRGSLLRFPLRNRGDLSVRYPPEDLKTFRGAHMIYNDPAKTTPPPSEWE